MKCFAATLSLLAMGLVSVSSLGNAQSYLPPPAPSKLTSGFQPAPQKLQLIQPGPLHRTFLAGQNQLPRSTPVYYPAGSGSSFIQPPQPYDASSSEDVPSFDELNRRAQAKQQAQLQQLIREREASDLAYQQRLRLPTQPPLATAAAAAPVVPDSVQPVEQPSFLPADQPFFRRTSAVPTGSTAAAAPRAFQAAPKPAQAAPRTAPAVVPQPNAIVPPVAKSSSNKKGSGGVASLKPGLLSGLLGLFLPGSLGRSSIGGGKDFSEGLALLGGIADSLPSNPKVANIPAPTGKPRTKLSATLDQLSKIVPKVSELIKLQDFAKAKGIEIKKKEGADSEIREELSFQ